MCRQGFHCFPKSKSPLSCSLSLSIDLQAAITFPPLILLRIVPSIVFFCCKSFLPEDVFLLSFSFSVGIKSTLVYNTPLFVHGNLIVCPFSKSHYPRNCRKLVMQHIWWESGTWASTRKNASQRDVASTPFLVL